LRGTRYWGSDKTAKREASRSTLLTKYNTGDRIKNNEKGGASGMYEGEKRCINSFGREHKENRPLLCPRSRRDDNIKMGLREVGWGHNWINLAQDKDRWLL